ncbi:MAG: hypothetical protein K1X86_09280 [Ignavibacteria bacterium]|nr:hypothetical protein [Ignavibacteria bacterium]
MNLFRVLISAPVLVFMLGLTGSGFAGKHSKYGTGFRHCYGGIRICKMTLHSANLA